MAHGSKKWIPDYRGRIKRSRHRTQQDWQGELGFERGKDRLIGWGQTRRKCPQCTYLHKQYANLPKYLHRWLAQCPACTRKRAVAWDLWHSGGERHNAMGSGPASFRRDIERERRAAYRNHMHRAKYAPELYDSVPTRYHRDAAWRYW